MSKVAVVTGGTSGIGKQTALALKAAGYTVYELSRRAQGVEGLHHLVADITREELVDAAIGEVLRQEGHIDVVVNNAGFGISGAVEFTSTEDAKSLTAAQGIGRKIAQRIILELKDKMAKETASGLDFSGGKGAAVPAVFTSKATEAAAALAVLGYSTQEVQMALKGVDVENLPLEEIIRQSLKKMVK